MPFPSSILERPRRTHMRKSIVLNLLPFELSDFANLFDSGINSTRVNVEERMKVSNMNLPIPWTISNIEGFFV